MQKKIFFILGFIVVLSMFFFLGNLIVSFTNIQYEESRYSVDKVKHSSDKEESSKKLKKDIEQKKQVEQTESKKSVALSFDDGPNPGTTKQLLEILKEKQVHATFFVLGENANKFPEIVKQAKKEGHEIGSHTFDHQNLTQLSTDEVKTEISKTDEVLEKIIGEKAEFLRPPYGSITELVARLTNRPIIDWSVDSEDWIIRNSEQIFQKIIGAIYDGSILLFHDIYPETVSVIPRIIDYLHEQGYQIETVGELLNHPKDCKVYYGKGDYRFIT
ncbi:TPA: polysaccharide deacetylase family protein [Enterococcus faecalis]|nr:polysaccharide deacetylase family protein [Enterococcus faecalis]HBI1691756.1 polysaccharide deacetylase family protein [Enterococcus faecalis]HBI1694535.1 polysaccharide deacetylase family protein [Enterococcus faecalis]HBI1697499.1 polysaccharide deacetylase family protein [Enterococcus faecalis]HBI1700177.1 polysaccharide deacetylase family protein [Enterococcus faecalis]